MLASVDRTSSIEAPSHWTKFFILLFHLNLNCGWIDPKNVQTVWVPYFPFNASVVLISWNSHPCAASFHKLKKLKSEWLPIPDRPPPSWFSQPKPPRSNHGFLRINCEIYCIHSHVNGELRLISFHSRKIIHGRYPVPAYYTASLSYYLSLQGFMHPKWCAGFLNHEPSKKHQLLGWSNQANFLGWSHETWGI